MVQSLYVPALAPASKHPKVFETFDNLQVGDSFLLINDHDPIPLYYEMKAERGPVFEWQKVEDGPETWKVEIKKISTGDAPASCAVPGPQTAKEAALPELNVTLLEPKLKHPTIFKHFDALQAGEAFVILNDHDPKPLYYQLIAERGTVFSWTYLEKGPRWWKVRIAKNSGEAGESIGQIVAKDIKKAEVFKKYGIDFCCGGKKSLQQACAEANVDVAEVTAALNNSVKTSTGTSISFDRWEPDFLADYIYNQHHTYYYDEAPLIADLLSKVVARHGDTHSNLSVLSELYQQLSAELKAHFLKEERVVFPFIKALVAAQKAGNPAPLQEQPSLTEPIQIMEADHEAAGDILVQIRKATNNFTPPENSCNSFQLLYKKLEELEADLHQHVHLENNVLFPKALQLEKSLR